jgi:hypothetical protein
VWIPLSASPPASASVLDDVVVGWPPVAVVVVVWLSIVVVWPPVSPPLPASQPSASVDPRSRSWARLHLRSGAAGLALAGVRGAWQNGHADSAAFT